MLKSKSPSEGHLKSAPSNSIQSTEGLSVPEVVISSALTANSNASFSPAPSSFALSHAANSSSSLMHHALTSGLIEGQFFSQVESAFSRPNERSSEITLVPVDNGIQMQSLSSALTEQSNIIFPSSS